MGRIAAFVTMENPSQAGKRIECEALVDTLGHRLVRVKRLDLK